MTLQDILNGLLGKCVWSEDDALTPDRERLEGALMRITGLSGRKKQRKPEFEIDQGDCTWEVYPDWVLGCSYPGNNSIYERRKNLNPTTGERIKDGIANADPEDIENIITYALALKDDLYSKKDTINSLFRLRKSLEGIWGHDLPEPILPPPGQ